MKYHLLYLRFQITSKTKYMKLKVIKAEESGRKIKATVHASGKLGFSAEAIRYLNIKESKSIEFAINEEDPDDLNLYGFIYQDKQEGAFNINKAGLYYYVNTKTLFDNLGVNYKNKTIIYDLVKGEYEGKPFVKMLRREIGKKNKNISAL